MYVSAHSQPEFMRTEPCSRQQGSLGFEHRPCCLLEPTAPTSPSPLPQHHVKTGFLPFTASNLSTMTFRSWPSIPSAAAYPRSPSRSSPSYNSAELLLLLVEI